MSDQRSETLSSPPGGSVVAPASAFDGEAGSSTLVTAGASRAESVRPAAEPLGDTAQEATPASGLHSLMPPRRCGLTDAAEASLHSGAAPRSDDPAEGVWR